jgi:hypothetical protein
MSDLNQFSDVEILAMTYIGESESSGHDYMVGTACTIVNRAKANRHWLGGDTLRGVCLQPEQYDVWLPGADRDRVIQIATQNPLYGPYEDSAEGDQSFRREADHGSVRKPIRRRSEATLALRCCQRLIGIVKRNLSGAKRREDGRGEDGGAGQGAAVPCPRLNTVEAF